MTALESKKRVSLVVLVGLFGTLTPLISPLEAQDPVAPSIAQPPGREQVRVMTGPDLDAIYLRIQSGDPERMPVGRGYEHWHKDEVVIRVSGFSTTTSPATPPLSVFILTLSTPVPAPASPSATYIFPGNRSHF